MDRWGVYFDGDSDRNWVENLVFRVEFLQSSTTCCSRDEIKRGCTNTTAKVRAWRECKELYAHDAERQRPALA